MKHFKYFFIVVTFLILSSHFAFSEPPKIIQTCHDQKTPANISGKIQKVEWQYCVYKTEGSDNNDVVYHFHGKDGNEIEEKGWASKDHYSYAIRDAWEKSKFKAPVVVSMTFGEVWLLVEKNESPVSGLYEFVTQAAIPTIEQELAKTITINKRHLIGESMGGFNASQLLLKSPQGYFTKTALICPAITTLSPFANKVEIDKYINETGALPDYVGLLIQVSQYFIPTFAAWDKTNPLSLVKKSLNEHSGSLYVSCGDKDEYGFFKGAKLFYDSAIANKMTATWVPIAGKGHCSVDAQSVADFFSK